MHRGYVDSTRRQGPRFRNLAILGYSLIRSGKLGITSRQVMITEKTCAVASEASDVGCDAEIKGLDCSTSSRRIDTQATRRRSNQRRASGLHFLSSFRSLR
ncbi:unnamed protein product [Somion occarium]|uniref:Uncharacterized protein n=1 Tax=Somion occarium TaxID=3059160 RepID=A0ABP1DEK3_9APHY